MSWPERAKCTRSEGISAEQICELQSEVRSGPGREDLKRCECYGREAGHVKVKAGENLACGRWGRESLEQFASATAVIWMANERLGNAALSTEHEMAPLARAGNKQASSIFDTAGPAFVFAITGYIATLNLLLYPLGGGVCEACDLLSRPIFRKLECRSYVYRLKEPEVPGPACLGARKTYIVNVKRGSGTRLLGACVLALESFKPSRQQ